MTSDDLYLYNWLDRADHHGGLRITNGNTPWRDDGLINASTFRSFERRGLMRRVGAKAVTTSQGHALLTALREARR